MSENKDKNKILTLILSCVLVISVCLNAYTIWRIYTANKQVAVFSTQVIVADDQILNLQKQLSDFNNLQKQVEDLQAQLKDSNEQIHTLETSLSESNSQIASLEQEIAENRVTIASLESQQSTAEIQQPQTQQSIQQSTNPPAGLGSMGTFGDMLETGSRPGDGNGAGFGHVE